MMANFLYFNIGHDEEEIGINTDLVLMIRKISDDVTELVFNNGAKLHVNHAFDVIADALNEDE